MASNDSVENTEKSWWDLFWPVRITTDLSWPEPLHAGLDSSDAMIVVQFRPEWEIQAYLRFARIPYRVENSRYVSHEYVNLPGVVDGQFIVPAEQAIAHISRTRKDLDDGLEREQKVESRALRLLVREGLQPLLRVLRYTPGDNPARQKVRPPMRKTLPWPMSLISPIREERRCQAEANARGFDAMSQTQLVERTRGLYKTLDDKLEGSDAYFYGASPTMLDAVVFGHLAEAWTVEALLDILPAFSNLNSFFRRICKKHFSPAAAEATHAAMPGASEARTDGGDPVVESPSPGIPHHSEEMLQQALMRADYVNSHNAFNQLPACAICAGAPYVGDIYVERAAKSSLPPPVLAGGNTYNLPPEREQSSFSAKVKWLTAAITIMGLAIVNASSIVNALTSVEFEVEGDYDQEEDQEEVGEVQD